MPVNFNLDSQRLCNLKSKKKKLRNINKSSDTYRIPIYNIIGVAEKKQKEKRKEKIFGEIIAESSPNWLKNNNIDIQEAQWTPSGINSESHKQTHHRKKMLKVKDRDIILKAATKK